MVTPAPALPDVPPPRSPVGGVRDRYRSLFVVGRGGMGTVEVALERRGGGFERIVALKRLLPDQARDPRHNRMFLREARLAAQLCHPNVVHAFSFGELYGELFLAMEYIEGETLARALATGRERGTRLDAATAAFVLAEVCDGLHAAHELQDERGRSLHVVHRDVSPHNVMIGYGGHVKVLDFGVAKFDAGGHETRTGEVKGKMAYMSPEQALGEAVDHRSDLYSVGAVLFECITGQRMWGDGTDLDIMRRLALEQPPHLDVVMPDAPKALVDLHARLVARDVAERPATAADVARELRAYAARWPAADRSAVAALMKGLFASEIETRRGRLDHALHEVVPQGVDALRRTIDLESGLESSTVTDPVIVSRRPERVRGGLVRRTLLGATLTIALGATTAAATLSRSDRGRPRPTERAATTSMTAAATPIPVSTPSPAPPPPASPHPAPSAPALAASAPSAIAGESTAAPARTPRKLEFKMTTPPPKSGAASRPPDVDPTPF